MSWVITGTQKIDPDAAVYLSRVEAVDGQTLEPAVRTAVEAFIVGCKADGIWTAIKASCILAGARTLTGALVPLVGAAPTNTGFVQGDYNRKTGLLGANNKILNSNRANNADPQDNNHNSIFVSQVVVGNIYYGANSGSTGGNAIGTQTDPNETYFRCRSVTRISKGSNAATGFMGVSRNSSAEFTARNLGTDLTSSIASQATSTSNLTYFNQLATSLAFYSIGESLNLALLDARVTGLINAFVAAIP
jgi:hypothetical protein